MAVLVIEGGGELRRLAEHLVEGSGKGMRSAVRASMRTAVRPVISQIKDNMMSESLPATGFGHQSPHGGGANQRFQAAIDRRKKVPSEAVVRKLVARSGLRASIAAGVGVNIGLNPKVPYIKIRVSTAAMPVDQHGLPRAIEKGKWRHPVFGNGGWVTQTGTPFFYPPIYRALPRIEAEVIGVAHEYVVRIAGRPVI